MYYVYGIQSVFFFLCFLGVMSSLAIDLQPQFCFALAASTSRPKNRKKLFHYFV